VQQAFSLLIFTGRLCRNCCPGDTRGCRLVCDFEDFLLWISSAARFGRRRSVLREDGRLVPGRQGAGASGPLGAHIVAVAKVAPFEAGESSALVRPLPSLKRQ